MSHFIGLVFVRPEDNLECMLAPFSEQDDKYCEFVDCTDEVRAEFESLPEVDETLNEYGTPYPYPCDKKHYPTINALAENWFGYEKLAGKWGYFSNPNAKWDWYAEGGRWDGYIINKAGKETNEELLTKIDWDKMLNEDKIPFCIVDDNGEWHERGQMGWWATVANEKEKDVWASEVKEYITNVLQDDDAEQIMVYAIDFHI